MPDFTFRIRFAGLSEMVVLRESILLISSCNNSRLADGWAAHIERQMSPQSMYLLRRVLSSAAYVIAAWKSVLAVHDVTGL